jgi:hypothetical protein
MLGKYSDLVKLTKSVLKKILKRFFNDLYNYIIFGPSQFRGIYKDFQEAEAAAPRRKTIGYNNSELALEYQASLNVNLDCSDYPVLFHLEHIPPASNRGGFPKVCG